jgi:hypothetical protein
LSAVVKRPWQACLAEPADRLDADKCEVCRVSDHGRWWHRQGPSDGTQGITHEYSRNGSQCHPALVPIAWCSMLGCLAGPGLLASVAALEGLLYGCALLSEQTNSKPPSTLLGGLLYGCALLCTAGRSAVRLCTAVYCLTVSSITVHCCVYCCMVCCMLHGLLYSCAPLFTAGRTPSCAAVLLDGLSWPPLRVLALG